MLVLVALEVTGKMGWVGGEMEAPFLLVAVLGFKCGRGRMAKYRHNQL